jgi:hypothetical protein
LRQFKAFEKNFFGHAPLKKILAGTLRLKDSLDGQVMELE